MRLRCHVALFFASAIAMAQGAGSVSDLVSSVRGEIARNRKDDQIAKAIRKLKLTERLDDRTIEILQSYGAGAESVEQLQLMRDRSATLPKPSKAAIEEPAAPTTLERVQIWNEAHENSLKYTDSLPDFICSEVVRRFTDPNEKGGWKLHDTLILKLTYFDKTEEYKLVSVNNHPTGMSYEQMGGAITEGEFGSMLAAIFALKSRTNREWDHWTILRGRPTHVYSFSISAANSEYGITSGTGPHNEERVKAGQHGYVYIDSSTKMVTRIMATTDDLPRDFDVRRVDLLLDYDFTDVGGQHYLLPLHSETKLQVPPFQHRNETDFLQYRKFSTDATITYDGTVKK